MLTFLANNIPKMCTKKFDVSGGVFFFVHFSHYLTGAKLNTHGRRDKLRTHFLESKSQKCVQKKMTSRGEYFFSLFFLIFSPVIYLIPIEDRAICAHIFWNRNPKNEV